MSAAPAEAVAAGAPPTTRDTWLLLLIGTCVSLASFLWYFRHDQILLYGDAVAHIAIARRVFDSITPGILQLGSVWLPLPHVLMLPFVISQSLWRSGAGASVLSMIAYIVGVLGIFRLVRTGLRQTTIPRRTVRVGAWLAAVLYLANPNLIYLQATAMTEPLYLALFIWAIVFVTEFALRFIRNENRAARSLIGCALCLFGAELTRYDGWFAVPWVALAIAVVVLRWRDAWRPQMSKALIAFVLITAAGPALWFAQNYAIARDPLVFIHGPYSARAIENKTALDPSTRHPGDHDARVAARYFVVDATLNLGELPWRRLLLWCAVAGWIAALVLWPGSLLWLLLWLPLPFYTVSIARGNIPIFMPVWPPYSYYNVRYGLELLPALAVFAALFFALISECVPSRKAAVAILIAGFTLGAATYASAYVVPGFRWSYLAGEPHRGPVVWREAVVNARTREAFEHKLATVLVKLPPTSTLLMYTGDHVGALQDAGIDLGRVINEGNYGWWEPALRVPGRAADYVISIAGDPVWRAVRQNPGGLCPIAVVQSEGQPRAEVFQACPGSSQPHRHSE
jgi:hypothetical protein